MGKLVTVLLAAAVLVWGATISAADQPDQLTKRVDKVMQNSGFAKRAPSYSDHLTLLNYEYRQGEGNCRVEIIIEDGQIGQINFTLNPSFSNRRAKQVLFPAYKLLFAYGSYKPKRISAKELAGDYQILWRETILPQWKIGTRARYSLGCLKGETVTGRYDRGASMWLAARH